MAKDDKSQSEVIIDPDIKTDLCTASKLVCDKPCWLYSIIFTAGSSNQNIYIVRDGFSIADKAKINKDIYKYNTVPVVFQYPMRFNKGLYIEFNTNGYRVFVQYKTDF